MYIAHISMQYPTINIVQNQRFTCVQCGRCCRRWHVALSAAEIRSLENLQWRQDDDPPQQIVTTISGHPYIAHRANGDCAFLDPATSLCRIHGRFGPGAKPLGCRVYPLNVVSTYWNEVSVTARMDCPAVQQNVGTPLAEQRDDIEKCARLLGIKGGFSSDDLEELSPAAVGLIVNALLESIDSTAAVTPAQRSLGLVIAVERLRTLGIEFLNDTATLEDVLPSVMTRVAEAAAQKHHRPVRVLSRALFRQWLAAYLRRYEDIVQKGYLARLARTWDLCLVFIGRGSFHRLGAEHPNLPLAEAGFFRSPGTPAEEPDADVWECYWRFLKSRLVSLQFFGRAYYDLPFFTGLSALALTYPLVAAAAQCQAKARGTDGIAAGDVQYAVGAVDHNFGRCRLLQAHLWRSVEIYFKYPRYGRLLAALA